MSVTAGTASGKSQASENFPVASFLIAPAYRAPIHAFYRFARAADDIADHPGLSADEKLARLDRLGAALSGAPGEPLASGLRAACATPDWLIHGQDLLDAFRLDATKSRYQSWDDLIAYCAKSAMPVGRFVLDVHGESRATFAASDALCAALQVINHLQDCGADYAELNRVYLPTDMLAAHGIEVDALSAARLGPGLRAVLDALLARTEGLLAISRALAPQVRDYRLRMEVSVIQSVAERLVARLRRDDPLARRIKLSPPDYFAALASGIGLGLIGWGRGG